MKTSIKINTLALMTLLAWTASSAELVGQGDEPSYQGHPLSWWVDQFGHNHYNRDNDPKIKEAISQIGTNGIPFLFVWMRSCDDMKTVRVEDLDRVVRAQDAAAALALLGTNADSALPELERMANDPAEGAGSQMASMALYRLGDEGLPALSTVLANPKVPDRVGLMRAMFGSFKTNAAVVPVYVKCLQDEDLREQAARSLRIMAMAPDVAVPGLTNCLQNALSASLRREVTTAISAFGRRASAATPLFLTRLHDPDVDIRTEATNALLAIAPEVLTKSPSQ